MKTKKLTLNQLKKLCTGTLSFMLIGMQVQAAGGNDNSSEMKPNILLILTDDMGYGDLKCYNPDSKIPTPNIDRLSREGVTFTDAHAAGSTCKPSRYGLLTGQQIIRAENNNDREGPMISEDIPTIADVLKKAGYRTAMVGKWHLGFDQKADEKSAGGFRYAYDKPMTGGPVDRGFDSYFGMHASLDIAPYFYIKDRTVTAPMSKSTDGHKSEDHEDGWNRIQGAFWREGPVAEDFVFEDVSPRFTREAIQVIESHEGNPQPLFLFLSYPSPHTPWLPTEDFKGKSGAGMYGDFTMELDHLVGQVLESIKEAGMENDTLVIFTSDNGPVWYDENTERFGHNATNELKGIKASVWEGGHRVPFIVKWPGHATAGATSDDTVIFTDFVKTFADLTGQEVEAYPTAMDGVSFLPSILNPETAHSRPPIIHSKGRSIRDGDWKYIEAKAKRGFSVSKKDKFEEELYNLKDDLGETNNLAKSHPEKVNSMKKKLEELREL